MTGWKLTRRGRAPGYRRRKPLPAVAAFVVLCVVAGVVWVTVFDSNGAAADRTHCNSPGSAQSSTTETPAAKSSTPAAPSPGRQLDRDALEGTPPLSPGKVRVHVLNAGGQRGQAGLVTLALKQLGFQPAAAPGNDPFYPDQELRCDGQIRFGPGGAAAARTLSLVDPCAQLVRDDRKDASVDFAIGTMFHDATPNKAARAALQALSSGGATGSGDPPQAGDDGHDVSGGSGRHVDPDLLTKARDVTCN